MIITVNCVYRIIDGNDDIDRAINAGIFPPISTRNRSLQMISVATANDKHPWYGMLISPTS